MIKFNFYFLNKVFVVTDKQDSKNIYAMKTRRKEWDHYFDNLKRERDIGLLGNECRFLVKTFYVFQNEVKLFFLIF
jgi:hypothetical protein